MSETYAERLLRERPTHTKGGTPIEIVQHGSKVYVYTYTGRSRNGMSSCYCPCDFPQLFGWERIGSRDAVKPPLVIKHRGYKYVRLMATIRQRLRK